MILNNVSFSLEKLSLSEFQQKLKEIISTVGNIQKSPLGKGEEIENIWNVSADDVEREQKVFYMNPCIAQNLYGIKKLKELGIPPESISLGIELLSYNKDGRCSFHFHIVVQHDNDTHIIDFSHDNYVFFYKGAYKNRNWKHEMTSLAETAIPASEISDSDTIFDLIDRFPAITKEFRTSPESIREWLNAQIQHLKREDTPEQRKNFAENGEKPVKIIDGNFTIQEVQNYLSSILNDQIANILSKRIEFCCIEIHSILQQPSTEENQQRVYQLYKSRSLAG